MKNLTIFDIAKILQFDDSQIAELKKNYDSYDDAKKVEVMDVMWQSFFDLHEKLSSLKYDQFMEEVAQGKRELKTDLFFQAKKAVMKDFEEILAGKPQENQQIEQLRNKLQSFTGGLN